MSSPSSGQKTTSERCVFDAFGTVVAFTSYGVAEANERAIGLVKEECNHFEKLLSAYDPLSDVGRINRARGSWVEIAPETHELLLLSIAYCEKSLGLFDITVKPLVDLWDVHRAVVPSEEQICHALAHVDYHAIELDELSGVMYARLTDPEAAIDLGGTAKGFIADKLCDKLIAQGCESFILSLGGNVAARGRKPDGKPFVVGVRDPNDHARVLGTVELHDASAVASGVTERYFEDSGKMYSHLINPKTGHPVETDVKSVTLVAKRSTDCDGFSTTLCMLGSIRGASYFEQLDELDIGIFACADRSVKTCSHRGARFVKES